MPHPWSFVMMSALLVACVPADASVATTSNSPVAAPPAAPTSVPPVRWFDDMGRYSRAITTDKPDAQRLFDQGMAFLHGFNHDEALRSFQDAASVDPDCAMAYFGIALASGPHINNPSVPPERELAAVAAIALARAATGASEIERELVEALATRYADPPPPDRRPLDEAYAAAMRALWSRHPTDADIGTWFAEAMMDLRPWDLWTDSGEPQPGTEEIVAVLERVMVLRPDHPLALHLYIHAVEASPQPGRADAAANGLRDLVPAHGHLQHMPSHIDVRRGRWAEAVDANAKAVAADQRYRSEMPEQEFYRLYMAHNRHMLAYAAMMIGRSAVAVEHMEALVEEIPADWARENPAIADGYLVMPLEVRMRFGHWDEILAAPEFPEHFPLSRALRHYARGVAYAATLEPERARAELDAFVVAVEAIPVDATFGNNLARDIASVAHKLLEGEVLYQEGKPRQAIAALEEAVAREDKLRYDEPPGWIQPVRHALGAVLLKERKYARAEAVFRRDLDQLPGNGWSLWGLAHALRLQKKTGPADEVAAEFQRVWAGADIELSSSCLCLPGV